MTAFKLFREEVWLANYSWICPILTTLCFIFLAWDVDLEEKVMVMRVVLPFHETYLQVGCLKWLLCELWNVYSSLGAVWGWIFMRCSHRTIHYKPEKPGQCAFIYFFTHFGGDHNRKHDLRQHSLPQCAPSLS